MAPYGPRDDMGEAHPSLQMLVSSSVDNWHGASWVLFQHRAQRVRRHVSVRGLMLSCQKASR